MEEQNRALHSFRFVDDRLNDKLIAELDKCAQGKFEIMPDKTISYQDADLFENTILPQFRSSIFATQTFQIISFPLNWYKSYTRYMSQHDIIFYEEVSDGEINFVVSGTEFPFLWDL